MTSLSEAKLEILPDPEALARRVADWLLAAAIAKNGVFAVALSGGSTPRRLYLLLAQPPYRERLPWSGTHWFWGDERFVPHDDTRSNYRWVRDALLSRAPVPPPNVHPIPTEGITLETSAAVCERELSSFYGAERIDDRPRFDIVLLGLGIYGHMASLFPDSGVLEVRDRWVAAVLRSNSEARITLTYPALESGRHVAFLVTGGEKRMAFSRLRRGDKEMPATGLNPSGELICS